MEAKVLDRIEITVDDFMAIGIGPLPPVYQPPSRNSPNNPVKRKEPATKPDNNPDKKK